MSKSKEEISQDWMKDCSVCRAFQKTYISSLRQMIEGLKKTQATRAIATGAYNQAIDDVLTLFK